MDTDQSSSIGDVVTNSQASLTGNDYSNSVHSLSNVTTSASLINDTYASKRYTPFRPKYLVFDRKFILVFHGLRGTHNASAYQTSTDSDNASLSMTRHMLQVRFSL